MCGVIIVANLPVLVGAAVLLKPALVRAVVGGIYGAISSDEDLDECCSDGCWSIFHNAPPPRRREYRLQPDGTYLYVVVG